MRHRGSRTGVQSRRAVGGWLLYLILASLALTGSAADPPCGKAPDLWFPAPGIVLSHGEISVQQVIGPGPAGNPLVVCEGTLIRVITTVDNLTCGDAGPFDVSLFYDFLDGAHLIGVQHVVGLDDCEHIVLEFVWDTTGVPPGEHTIIAVADSGGDVVELSETNNQYTFETKVEVRPLVPLIDADKVFIDPNGGSPAPGETIVYEITIRNDGCRDHHDNPGHEFTDEIPAFLTYAGAETATSGVVGLEGNRVVWNGEIPAGGAVTITFEVVLDDDVADLETICNQGMVHWDSDGDDTNDSHEPTDDPSTAAVNDPTCLTVHELPPTVPMAGTIDAPTLTEWGAIAFGVLLAFAFVGMLLRRRQLTGGRRRGEEVG
jgi:hypothetical protein